MSGTPDERQLANARSVLRSVITSTRSPTPRASSFGQERLFTQFTEAAVPPLPTGSASAEKGTQTENYVPIEGLVKAAGRSLVGFAEELRSLERTVESNHKEILTYLKQLRLDTPGKFSAG